MLGDVWSRPEMIPDGKNLRPLWRMNLVVDTKDMTYYLVAENKARSSQQFLACDGHYLSYAPQHYPNLIPKYCSECYHGPPEYIRSDAFRALFAIKSNLFDSSLYAAMIHRYLFLLLYGKEFQFPEGPEFGEKSEILAEVICYADFYGILGMMSRKIEQHFLAFGGVEEDMKHSPMFYLIVAYYLQSEILFASAMKNVVGQGRFPSSKIEVPVDIVVTEHELKTRMVGRISAFVSGVSAYLGFNKKEERIYSERSRKHLPRYGRLSSAQSKAREIAKKALMNWVAISILAPINFTEPMRMSTEAFRLFYKATATRNVSPLLEPNGVKSLASKYGMDAALIEDAFRQELERIDLSTMIPNQEDLIDSDDPEQFKVDFSSRTMNNDHWYLSTLESEASQPVTYGSASAYRVSRH